LKLNHSIQTGVPSTVVGQSTGFSHRTINATPALTRGSATHDHDHTKDDFRAEGTGYKADTM